MVFYLNFKIILERTIIIRNTHGFTSVPSASVAHRAYSNGPKSVNIFYHFNHIKIE